MIKLKRLVEEKQATEVKDIELCGKQDCLADCYDEKKEEQQEQVDELMGIEREKEVPASIKEITPTQKPITEAVDVKDRKELATMLSQLKSEGKRAKISRSKNDGYRYSVTVLEEDVKEEDKEEGKELPPVQPEEPIVVPTEDEADKELKIVEATKFSLISNLITKEWEAVESCKSTLTTLELEDVKDESFDEVALIINNMIDERMVSIGLLNKIIGVNTDDESVEK